MLKYNRPRSIRLPKGRKSCGKSKKCLRGKGFQCSVFSNLSELNLILGNGKHTRRKGHENVRERERGICG